MNVTKKLYGLAAVIAIATCYTNAAEAATTVTATSSVSSIFLTGAVVGSLSLKAIDGNNYKEADTASATWAVGTNGGDIAISATPQSGGIANSDGTFSFTGIPNVDVTLEFTGCHGTTPVILPSNTSGQVPASDIPLSCYTNGQGTLTLIRPALSDSNVPSKTLAQETLVITLNVNAV